MSSNLLRASEGAKYLGISKSTFWRWVAAEKLPQGIRLSARCTVWRQSDLDAFVESMANSTTKVAEEPINVSAEKPTINLKSIDSTESSIIEVEESTVKTKDVDSIVNSIAEVEEEPIKVSTEETTANPKQVDMFDPEMKNLLRSATREINKLHAHGYRLNHLKNNKTKFDETDLF